MSRPPAATWTSTALPSSDAMAAALNVNTTARTTAVITAAEGPVTAAHSGAAIRAGLCIRTARRHAEHDSHTSTRTTPDFAGFVTLSLSCDAKLPLRPPLAGPPGTGRPARAARCGPGGTRSGDRSGPLSQERVHHSRGV